MISPAGLTVWLGDHGGQLDDRIVAQSAIVSWVM